MTASAAVRITTSVRFWSGILATLLLKDTPPTDVIRAVRGVAAGEPTLSPYMSVPTVKAHVSRILEKLELNNRVQIALLAHDAGET